MSTKRDKRLKRFGIVSLSLIGLWILLRATGMLAFYSAATTSSYPTYKVGDYIFASNLFSVDRFDVVTYTPPNNMSEEIWFHRVIGLGGETIEVRNGVVFINGEELQEQFDKSRNYYVSLKQLRGIQNILELEDNSAHINTYQTTPDSIVTQVLLSDSELTELNMILPSDAINVKVHNHNDYPSTWTTDNFGPFEIPEKYYFIMGDSRNNSVDSRLFGPVHEDRVTGVAF